MKPKVLFFFNDLNCTGAEILLFNFIVELNKKQKAEIGIVTLKQGGELVSVIPTDIPIFYFDQTFSLKDKILFHFGKDVLKSRLAKIFNIFSADYFYFNTISQVGLLRFKVDFPVKTFLHIHELLYNFESVKSEEINLILNETDHLISCSLLVEKIFDNIFSGKITTINSIIVSKEFVANLSPNFNKKIRIVSSGTICYRKGTDIFLELANLLPNSSYEFIWLGRFAKNGFAEIIKLKNNKNSSVKFVQTNSNNDYQSLLKSADIFVSTSREESMGMVMMEAVSLGIPVIATNSGGSKLIINDSNGKIVYDNRPEAIAKTIQDFSIENFKKSNSSKLPFSFDEEFAKFEKLFS